MSQPRHRAKRNRKGTPKPKGLSPDILEAVGKDYLSLGNLHHLHAPIRGLRRAVIPRFPG